MAGSSCSAPNVAGPSMSGIITSRRMTSGRDARAEAMPCTPESAVRTSHSSSVNSSVASATSRMSSSSSMINTRLRCTFHLRFGRHQIEEADDLLFELLERDAALDQELRRSETQPFLFRRVELQRGVDDQRDVRERVALLQPVDDGESIHLREDEIEDDQVGTPGHDEI